MKLLNSLRLIGLAAALASMLSACGVNPVTGKKEIQFVSEAQEREIGEKNYAPTRQGEGGDHQLYRAPAGACLTAQQRL